MLIPKMLLSNLFEFQYSVVSFLFVIRIDLWPIVGKELSPWLFACAVCILQVVESIVSVPFTCIYLTSAYQFYAYVIHGTGSS